MPTVVTRLYNDGEKLDGAIAALREEGFGALDYTVVSPADSNAADALASAGVLKRDVPGFAQGVSAGNTALVVRAPFGAASTAVLVMNHFHPVDAGAARGEVHVESDQRAGKYVMTGALIVSGPMVPAIVDWKTPFENMFWFPSIFKSKSKTALFTRTTTMIPLPLIFTPKKKTKLSANPTPLSSALKIPLLTRQGGSRTRVW